jgi:hypothetical protein
MMNIKYFLKQIRPCVALFLLMGTMLMVSGCATEEEEEAERAQYEQVRHAAFAALPLEQQQLVKGNKICDGMTVDAVKYVAGSNYSEVDNQLNGQPAKMRIYYNSELMTDADIGVYYANIPYTAVYFVNGKVVGQVPL